MIITINEKEKIEKFTAEKFIEAYNARFNTTFAIKEHSDKPDFICKDKNGVEMKLETTLTEDQDNDIRALLGRSEHKNFEYVRKHGMNPASALLGNVMKHAYNRISEKMLKNYGKNVALVLRDASPLEWDWDICLPELKKKLESNSNPFDKGVWILTISQNQNKIFQVL
ncbi:hypothetical protein HYR65_02910 [Candidatus Azambacteria bacterium]|nr:hypothetical protein [Candidatus Azambacteria bacterium]